MKCNGCGTECGIWYQTPMHGPRCIHCKEKLDRQLKRRDDNAIDDKGRIKPEILYDEFSDVLYISFGHPRPGIANEVEEGVLVRTDQETGEVIGITIIDFKERYLPSPKISIEKRDQES